ncbi:hypothetical protein NGRA_1087 [Nosema granulosis]|uniref:Uncharacterized protein n=1 Tax=Nosema granulosis TaxID=83296 RepID=A0A9P6KZQ0_9MICR|nr:hypothetical protein NGRA_1087 [Nosema granulosis]
MVDNGEIEFFEFMPTDFLNDLQTCIEETICKFVDSEFTFAKSAKRKKIKEMLMESNKKNLFLFRNFVLKNILRFPPKFKMERKKTDYVSEDLNLENYELNINKLIDGYEYLHKLKLDKAVAEYENKQLKSILSNEADLREMGLCLLNLKDKHRRIQEYVKKIPFCSLNDEDFNSLLEHRELRTEMLKKELERLQEAIDVDYLNSLI